MARRQSSRKAWAGRISRSSFHKTLEEEKEANQLLTNIAQPLLDAASEEGEEFGEKEEEPEVTGTRRGR